MNRRLDGTPLTNDDMIDMAVKTGVVAAADVPGWIASGAHKSTSTSFLKDQTRQARFDAWARGELILDTRSDRRGEKGCGR